MSPLMITLIAIGVVFGLFVLISLLFRVVVSTNEVHIIQTRNKSIPYGKGEEAGNVYYNFPSWFPFIGIERIILPVSNFSVLINDYGAFDENKVPFLVDVASFFRISNPTEAAQKIANFEELQTQLQLILRGSIRSVFATKPIVNIMEDREAISELFNKSVTAQLSNWGVESVKSVEIMDIKDDAESRVIQNIKDQKSSEIEKNSRIEIANNIKAAKIAEIEADKEASIINENALREIGEKKAEKERLVGISNEKSLQDIADEAKVTTEKQMEVKQVEAIKQAEIKKREAEIMAEQEKSVKITNADADKIEAEKQAQAELYTTTQKAEGDLILMTKNAEGILKEGQAQADATKAMEIAKVSGQIELAEKISEKEGYMEYLQMIEAIKASEKIGVSRSDALQKADMKILANTGNIDGGINNALDIFSSKGGASLGGMLENLNNTELGQQLLNKFLGKKEDVNEEVNLEEKVVVKEKPKKKVIKYPANNSTEVNS